MFRIRALKINGMQQTKKNAATYKIQTATDLINYN